MNLSDCKTIEEYREAAHYWQKKWQESDNLLNKIWKYCKVILFLKDPLQYPLEHTMIAKKDMRNEIENDLKSRQ